MKIYFEGWRRVVTEHAPETLPVEKRGEQFFAKEDSEEFVWESPRMLRFRVNGLALSGDFLASQEFTSEDLVQWARALIREDPCEAARFFLQMQSEAIDAIDANSLERA